MQYLIKLLKLLVANSKPSIKQLLPFVGHMGPTWYEVGAMLLDVTQESQLNLIQDTYGTDAKRCCLAMLKKWMDTHPKATWHHLVTALRSPGVDLAAVASEMEKNFTGKVEHFSDLVMHMNYVIQYLTVLSDL